MQQTRICHHISSACEHSSIHPVTFLDLPKEIRFQIYRHAGLVYDDPITISLRTRVPFITKHDPHYDRRDDLWEYWDLRLVSREVSADAYECLCASNNIVLRDFLSVEGHRLSKPSIGTFLRHVSHLTIKHVITIRHGFDSDPKRDKCYEVLEFMNHSTSASPSNSAWNLKDSLHVWEFFVSKLTDWHTSAFRLTLVFDVSDETAAKQLLQPLEHIEKLSKCTIRLSEEYDPRLTEIARETVLRLTDHGRSTPEPFRFSDLPTELRQHILSYTDLVSPYCEIMWSPERGYHLADWYPRLLSGDTTNEFCSRRHSVYPKCSCWTPPIPLFMVSQTMLSDARAVFFSSNRFVVKPDPPARPHLLEPQSGPFEASTFLTEAVPEGALRHLRDLEIVMHPSAYSPIGLREWSLEDWVSAIKHAGKHVNNLCLSLDMSSDDHEPGGSDMQDLIDANVQLVKPLARLRPNLRDFDVDPWTLSHTKLKDASSLVTLVMGREFEPVDERRISRWQAEKADLVGTIYLEGTCGKWSRRSGTSCPNGTVVGSVATWPRHRRR